MFQASRGGCITCVQHYLTLDGIEVSSVSEEGWNVLEYAMRGVREGNDGAAAVLRYLREMGAEQADDETHSDIEPIVCALGKLHMPSSAKAGQRKYFMFQSAYEGCLHCVQAYLERGVDIQSKSDWCSYSVLDWAKYGVTEGVATSNEVVNYLEKEFRSLSTSEPSGTACQAWRSHKVPVEHWGDLRQ